LVWRCGGATWRHCLCGEKAGLGARAGWLGNVGARRRNCNDTTFSISRNYGCKLLCPQNTLTLANLSLRPSHLSTPDRCCKACTSPSTPSPPHHPLLPPRRARATTLPHTSLLIRPQRRQRHSRAPQVGRDRVQRPPRERGPIHEHPALQHGGIRQRRQQRHSRAGFDPLQQCALDWAGGWGRGEGREGGCCHERLSKCVFRAMDFEERLGEWGEMRCFLWVWDGGQDVDCCARKKDTKCGARPTVCVGCATAWF
jgi:hypothetical protein